MVFLTSAAVIGIAALGIARSSTLPCCLAAALGGVAQAQRQLDIFYGNGQGVPQDYSEAVRWK